MTMQDLEWLADDIRRDELDAALAEAVRLGLVIKVIESDGTATYHRSNKPND